MYSKLKPCQLLITQCLLTTALSPPRLHFKSGFDELTLDINTMVLLANSLRLMTSLLLSLVIRLIESISDFQEMC